MMFVKDSACSQVALRVRGDTGQSKGGTQKSVDRVHSTCNRTGLGKEMVRLPGIEPGLQPWKGCVITPRQQAQVFTRGRSVEGRRPKPETQWLCFGWLTTPLRFKAVVEVGLSGRSVEGRVILKQNVLSWMVSGRVRHGEQSA